MSLYTALVKKRGGLFLLETLHLSNLCCKNKKEKRPFSFYPQKHTTHSSSQEFRALILQLHGYLHAFWQSKEFLSGFLYSLLSGAKLQNFHFCLMNASNIRGTQKQANKTKTKTTCKPIKTISKISFILSYLVMGYIDQKP